MRKLATLSMALMASFALAGAASATMSAAITGPSTPGTNTYTITMSFATGDNVAGLTASVVTNGLYTGVFSDAASPAGFSINLNGPGAISCSPGCPAPGSSGTVGSWGVSNGSTVAGGTYTIGTVEITVVAGNHVDLSFVPGGLDGFTTFNGTAFTTVLPNGPVTGVTVTAIPEPTTAALLGLGIVGLVVSGRRARA